MNEVPTITIESPSGWTKGDAIQHLKEVTAQFKPEVLNWPQPEVTTVVDQIQSAVFVIAGDDVLAHCTLLSILLKRVVDEADRLFALEAPSAD